MPVFLGPDWNQQGASPASQSLQPIGTNGAAFASPKVSDLPISEPYLCKGSSDSAHEVPSFSQLMERSGQTFTAARMQTTVSSETAVSQKEMASESQSEEAVDYLSVRGVFGWATVDGINIPYLVRKDQKYVSVRIVERKILINYPNHFPDELAKKGPLISYFVTEAEAKLLNEINTVHCSFEYGDQPFTSKDLMVILSEFEEFYELVKRTYPKESFSNSFPALDTKTNHTPRAFGWMQINNTVVPYVVRSSGKFLPLSVIVHAANLLTPGMVEGLTVDPNDDELSNLNAMCEKEGFRFSSFGRSTKLIHIAEVVKRNRVRITELPLEKPMEHAQYIESGPQTEAHGRTSQPPVSAVNVNPMSLPYQQRPPDFNIYTPFNSIIPPVMGMPHVPTFSPALRSSAPSFTQNLHRESLPASTLPSISASGARLKLVSTQAGPIFCALPPSVNSNLAQHTSTNLMNSNGSQMGLLPGLSSSQHLDLHKGPLPSHTFAPNVSGRCMGSKPAQAARLSPSSSFLSTVSLAQCLQRPPLPNYCMPSSHFVPSPNYVRPAMTTDNGSRPNLYFPTQTPMTTFSKLPMDSSVLMPGYPPGNRLYDNVPVRPQPCCQQQLTQPQSAQPKTFSQLDMVDNEDPNRLVESIGIVLVHGKKISCLRRNSTFRSGSFCLVEAVLKLYFPNCKLFDFVSALRNVLGISLWKCSPPETEAFIRYYKLPVSRLNDDSMINIDDLVKYFPQISFMFVHAIPKDPAAGVSTNGGIGNINRSKGIKRLASPNQPIQVVLNSNERPNVISLVSPPVSKRRYEDFKKEVGQDHQQTYQGANGDQGLRPLLGAVEALNHDSQVIIID